MATAYKENCTMRVAGNPGTGDVTTAGVVPGSQSLGGGDDGRVFVSRIYSIDATGQAGSGLWEVQLSTWTNSSSSLSRSSGNVIDGSSGPGTLVSFAAGTQRVFVQFFGPNLKFTGTTQADAHYGTLVTAADGGTVTFDMSLSNLHTVELHGSRTLAVSNDNIGQTFLIRILQDSGGGKTVTWWSGIKWPDGTEPTLTATVGKTDVFSFIKTDTNAYDGFTVGLNL